ncbi:MAG: ATP synthase F0 subunit C [Candidatus Omnitrophica bacterium]|nr:ATP synthase F0 subunit C [Candidatus Omnitrophota bacterium]
MDLQTGIALSIPVGLGLAALGTGIGLGRAVGSAMEAIGRQPEASNKIMINMIIGCAIIEAITIYVLVFAFIWSGKLS